MTPHEIFQIIIFPIICILGLIIIFGPGIYREVNFFRRHGDMCNIVGHRFCENSFYIAKPYLDGTRHPKYVIEIFYATRNKCQRCGKLHPFHNLESVELLSSCAMHADDAAFMNEMGWVPYDYNAS